MCGGGHRGRPRGARRPPPYGPVPAAAAAPQARPCHRRHAATAPARLDSTPREAGIRTPSAPVVPGLGSLLNRRGYTAGYSEAAAAPPRTLSG